MSTKIFPHIPRKIKPPKAPDPQLDAMFEARAAEQRQREAQRAEERRIMAQLRAEELAKRAAKLQPTQTKTKEWCCNFCWGMQTAEMMFANRKNLWRIYRAITDNRPELIADPWLKDRQLDLGKDLRKAAKAQGHELTLEQIAKIVIRATDMTLQVAREEFPKVHREKRAEAMIWNDPKRFCD